MIKSGFTLGRGLPESLGVGVLRVYVCMYMHVFVYEHVSGCMSMYIFVNVYIMFFYRPIDLVNVYNSSFEQILLRAITRHTYVRMSRKLISIRFFIARTSNGCRSPLCIIGSYKWWWTDCNDSIPWHRLCLGRLVD